MKNLSIKKTSLSIFFKTSWLVNFFLAFIILLLTWKVLEKIQNIEISLFTAEAVLKQILFGVAILIVNLALASQLSSFWQRLLAITSWFVLVMLIFYLVSIIFLSPVRI